MAISVENFFLDPRSQATLQSRIQQMIAQGILSGRFRAGEKLPSSRKLAAHLGVSRITVTLAYTELVASDYLTARGRSGYYVSENAPEPLPAATPRPQEDRIDWMRAIGQRFTGGATPEKPLDWARYRYPFIYGQTDASLFDHANWRLCALQALGQKDFAALTSDQYDQDDPQLVEFIARHTLPRRGIIAEPSQILVTMGAQNALWLAAQVLLTQRRRAAIEDPCYPALRDVLTQSRCHLSPVPVDSDGLPPDLIPDGTDVIFTTPSHQSPTSATMPLARRHALLERAREMEALIVEDDYEFEMAFLRKPSPALKSLDEDGRVIYVGSFSKSLFPGLRLGYLVGSAPFIREARALRASVLRHPPGLMQRAAAYFLSLGHYDALIRRTARVYAERRRVMEQAMADHGLTIAGRGAHGGSSFWMAAPEGVDTGVLATRLRDRDVLIEAGRPFFARDAPPRNFYRLAYSSIPSERIPEGVARIARTIGGV
ncbi:GntR family transcriptional regulator / MocR family aminotransferase [Lutimaribacter pacificus]|uniref:Transcriptional regulator, GntR family n=1 Tax=Lutimaribacter pacificus TaxID=391948 RepID=A0A1H0I1J5_9RHOB|nr:PLP-dependent aminotransferase family protein [Lutimaribacter pacificus]SDO24961.1 GntR family transcriptional regulator / MocR family aminotransferase [Lutimaribacter pacificus]SHK28539.1 transcriptional regulator, GntR family [Lutimaribacter pacificus]